MYEGNICLVFQFRRKLSFSEGMCKAGENFRSHPFKYKRTIVRLKSLVLFFFWDDFSLANLFHGKLYAFTVVCANLCNFCRCPDSIHDIIHIEVINFLAFMQKIDNTQLVSFICKYSNSKLRICLQFWCRQISE